MHGVPPISECLPAMVETTTRVQQIVQWQLLGNHETFGPRTRPPESIGRREKPTGTTPNTLVSDDRE